MATDRGGAAALRVEALSPEGFTPYGEVIAPLDDGARSDDAALDLSGGRPRFYIMRLAARPLSFDAITRHRRVTQCLAAVGGGDWLLAVAPPDGPDEPDAVPDETRLKAFRVPGDRAVKLHRGTWHAGPFFEGDAMSFFNLELDDTNEVDHHTARLARTYRFDG